MFLILAPLVFLLPGYPLARLFLSDEKTFSLKLLLTAFAFSLFLTYPAAVLTTIIEGQSAAAIYSVHLPKSLFSLAIVSFPFWILMWRKKLPKFNLPKFTTVHLFLFLIILLYSFFVFWNLGRADILGDDYDLAYQAYNLQDGILAARKAFIISFNTHPPLFMTIKHFWLQLVSPFGLETVPAWGYRGMEGILGIGTILTVYALTRSRLAVAILAVNNYMVFLGRVYLREMYLVFFLTLALYFFLQKKRYLFAFFFACGLLIKTSAVVLLPLFLFVGINPLLLALAGYSPVILYNLSAYVTTGHLDATFSKIFGLPHPFLTGSASPWENLTQMISYLSDLYSLPVFLLFLFSMIFSVLKRENLLSFFILLSSFLFFVYSGPLREYYLLFLTIPFVVLTVSLFRHSGRVQNLLLFTLIVYSFWYSLSGQSQIRKIYEPVRGWPALATTVFGIYQPGDCLEKGSGVNDLALRAYFQTDDAVKKALIGKKYPHYYKMCDEIEKPNKVINIFYDKSGKSSYF